MDSLIGVSRKWEPEITFNITAIFQTGKIYKKILDILECIV